MNIFSDPCHDTCAQCASLEIIKHISRLDDIVYNVDYGLYLASSVTPEKLE